MDGTATMERIPRIGRGEEEEEEEEDEEEENTHTPHG